MVFLKISSAESVQDTKTRWKDVYLGTLITFLCAVENHMIHMGEWNYMRLLDKDTDATFFATVSSITRAVHAIFTLIFAFWSYRQRITKFPLIVGRLIAFIACILYLFIEYIPHNRRYTMLCIYMLFGMSFAMMPILRAYIARISSNEDRAAAYALFGTSHVFSGILAPVGQLAFSGIDYPGYSVFGDVKFHIYSAPIWIGIVTNIIALITIHFFFDDPLEHKKFMEDKLPIFKNLSWTSLKQQAVNLRTGHLPWLLIGVIFFERMITGVTQSSIFSVNGPIMTDVFGFTGPTAIKIKSFSQLTVGCLALCISAAFILFKLGKRASSRSLILFAVTGKLALYLISFPWPIQPFYTPIAERNETANTGCSSERYSWCETSLAPNPYIYITVNVLANGFTFPTSHIGWDTLYSKILGPGDQSLMQGAFVFIEDVVMTISPIYASNIFQRFSMTVLWIANTIIISIGLIVLLFMYKRFKPYS